MERPPHYVRLYIAVTGAVSSVAFVAAYSSLMAPIIRSRVHYVVQQLPLLTYSILHYAWCALVVPLCLLIAGIILLQRNKTGSVFEMVVGGLWLFSFVWVMFCLLVWELPELTMQGPIR
jgi:hypothetical protein